MKLNLTLLICLFTAFAFGQEMNCSRMELYLGQDKNLLESNLTKTGYNKPSNVQSLSQELANKLTNLSGVKRYGVTLTKGLTKMIYIIYNANGKCAGYTFITIKGEFNTDTLEKEIEALGYENDNNPYAMNTSRGYSKGKKHFVLLDTDINGRDAIFICVHNVNPK